MNAAGATRANRLLVPIVASICIAWALAIAGEVAGFGKFLHHDALIEGGLPAWAAVLLFVLAWQAMIAAMMLPSSLPLMRGFAIASAMQPRPALQMAAFVGGYASIWTVFGLAAFAFDIGIHAAVDRWSWLAQHPALIASGVLALAGAFQFSNLKDVCLRKCRVPGLYLLRHYRRGAAAAFALGRNHGLFCVGCCWALMLISFAAGFASLWWMAALTALMVYEKVGRYGKRIVPAVGVALLAVSALALAHPALLSSPIAR